MSTITQTASYYDLISEMAPGSARTFHHVSWEDYEELLEQVGEAGGLRISFCDGRMQVMSLSAEHEKYARFFEKIAPLITIRLRINVLSFGSATMKKSALFKGKEPDACFYVQTADVLGHKIQLDFETDPPPDLAVEVDIHHTSRDMFLIYAALGVREIWRFDGKRLAIHHLQQDRYVERQDSLALPMLSSRLLTEFLIRLREEGEFQTLLAFDEWLQSLPK
jgi:Uma2 family endonuclease